MFKGLGDWLNTDARRLHIFLAFVAMVFLMGGASRPDALSLLVLRPVTCLFLGYAVWTRLRAGGERLGIPFYLLLAFMLLHILQLVPLPASIWSSLPERQQFAALDAAAGIGAISRPVTLSPATTTNSLFSLLVPCATFLLYDVLAPQDRRWAVRAILIATLASCLLGLLQLSGGENNAFYLYRVTNGDAPVGLFSNRNHQAVFLAASIVLAAWSVRERVLSEAQSLAGYIADCGLIAIALVILLISGSRGGAIFGAVALCAAAALMLSIKISDFSRGGARDAKRQSIFRIARIFSIAGIIVSVGLISLAVFASRDNALDRFFVSGQGDAIRGNTFPYLKQLLGAYFPYGSGFGTFEYIYRMVEPQETLRPSYLNKAHNDWLQIVIEGGVAAGLILLGFVLWFMRAAWLGLVNAVRRRAALAPAVLVIILFFAASSAVDYPLRVPSLMVFFVILIELLRLPEAPGEAAKRSA